MTVLPWESSIEQAVAFAHDATLVFNHEGREAAIVDVLMYLGARFVSSRNRNGREDR